MQNCAHTQSLTFSFRLLTQTTLVIKSAFLDSLAEHTPHEGTPSPSSDSHPISYIFLLQSRRDDPQSALHSLIPIKLTLGRRSALSPNVIINKFPSPTRCTHVQTSSDGSNRMLSRRHFQSMRISSLLEFGRSSLPPRTRLFLVLRLYSENRERKSVGVPFESFVEPISLSTTPGHFRVFVSIQSFYRLSSLSVDTNLL